MFKAVTLPALCVALLTSAASTPADAAQLLFDFSGPSGTAVFQLAQNPTPDYVNTILPGSDQFGFNNVAGVFNGVSENASTINFGEGIIADLNIVADGLGFTQFSSPTLFTGSAGDPTFLAGTFNLNNPFLGNGTLTISNVVAGVPEPATWAMMILGFGLIGATMRYRRRDANAFA